MFQYGDIYIWEREWYPWLPLWTNSEGPDLWLGGEVLAAECGREYPNRCEVQIVDTRQTVAVEESPWSAVKRLYQ
jgi:hypothetical protein